MNLLELSKVLEQSKVVIFDFETSSLHHKSMELDGLALMANNMEPVFVNLQEENMWEAMEFANEVFSYDALFVAHNLQFDGKILKYFFGVYPTKVFDTMIASWYLDENRPKGLKDLGASLLGLEMRKYKDVEKENKNIGKEWLIEYAKLDVVATYGLYEMFSKELHKIPELETLFFNLEMPFVEVLIDIALRGIKIDMNYLDKMTEYFSEKRTELEIKLTKMFGPINLNSPMQLSEKLYGLKVSRKGGVVKTEKLPGKFPKPPIFTAGGAPSTANGALERLNTPEANALQEYREVVKLLDTYLIGYRRFIFDGVIYPSFNHVGTVSGRLSSSEPNMQNLGRDPLDGYFFRACFIARPGYKLIVADEAQLELRVLTHYSKDPALLEAFSGEDDFFYVSASQLLDKPVEKVTKSERTEIKTINYGIIYGAGPTKLAEMLSKPKEDYFMTFGEAKELMAKYFDTYKGVRYFFNDLVETMRFKGYINTIIGRRRRIPELKYLGRKDPLYFRGARQTNNSLVQGSASDILKVAMVKISRAFKEKGLDAHILLQIHDELVVEAAEADVERATEIVKLHMEKPFPKSLLVPLVVKPVVCYDWGSGKD